MKQQAGSLNKDYNKQTSNKTNKKGNHIIIIMNETGYITIDPADIKRVLVLQTTPYTEIQQLVYEFSIILISKPKTVHKITVKYPHKIDIKIRDK